MDPSTAFDKLNGPQLEFSWDEISSATAHLSLNWVTLNHYVVVMSGRIDAVIGGEPHIALQLWLNMKSGRFMSRIWDQTVAFGTAVNVTQFIDACATHFQGRPCIGYPITADDNLDKLQDFVISQSPVPRKISKACQRILPPDGNVIVQSCPECFKLSVTAKEEIIADSETLEPEIRLALQEEHGALIDGDKVEDSEGNFQCQEEIISESDESQQQSVPKRKRLQWRRLCPKKESSENTEDIPGHQNQGLDHLKCGACQLPCHNRLHFERHKCKTGLLYMECEVCDMPVNFEHYPKHMLIKHGKKGKFYKTCEWCKKQYSVTTLARHMEEIHFYGRFFCPKCTFRGDFAAEVVSHMTEEHSKDTSATCPACKKDQNVLELKDHYEKCVDIKIKKWRRTTECETMCANCGKTLKNIACYQKHIKSYCKQTTEGRGSTDENVLLRYCEKCGKGFTSSTRLRHHIQSVHDKIEYNCPQCSMKFPTDHHLKRHKNSVHSTDEKFKCKHCGQQFGEVANRKVHEAYHEDPKFQCRHCPKKVKTAMSLTAHERYHTGEKPFKCQTCDSGFVSLARLRQHERGVHKITGPRGGKTGWNYKTMEKLKN